MKVKIFILILLCVASELSAQHSTRFSQYSLNPLSVNPAFAGIEDYVDFKVGLRQQWSSFANAPLSYYFVGNSVITRKDPSGYVNNSLRVSDATIYQSTDYHKKGRLRHGIGVVLENINQGSFEEGNYRLAYSLHLPLSDRLNLAVGTTFGLFTRAIGNNNSFEVRDPDQDALYQALLENGLSQTFFDINLGALLYSNKFFLGFSALPMVSSDISKEQIFTADSEITLIGLIGTRIGLNDIWQFTPSVLTRYSESTGSGFDVNLKISRMDHFWVGVSYRQNSIGSFNLGTMFNQKYTLGYSFDYSFSEINSVSSGSHEIVFGMSLLKQNHHRSLIW